MLKFKKGVSNMEKLLQRIVTSQERTEKQLNNMQNDIQNIKSDVSELKADVSELKTDVSELKTDVRELKIDVQDIKESVHRIELHQEESIMSMLRHIKKQGEVKESQIQVLNKRLFEVETKAEHAQQ
jgi:chromosome segregation ATPase